MDENEVRANKALSMMKEAGYEGIICDAVCDLHHLADLRGQDWRQILEEADLHHQAERQHLP